jgi:hypothetical protein
VGNAYFKLIETSAKGATYDSAPSTGGPWSPDQQHGGPPNALLVHVAEQLVTAETGRQDLHALRLAAEFLRPVPVGPVTVSARVLRVARTVVLVETSLGADGRNCLAGRIWLVRSADTTSLVPSNTTANVPADGLPGMPADFPYGQSIEWRSVHGGLHEIGPAMVWARPSMPIVGGYELTGLQRAALVGDSASGISAELDWNEWSFVNIDLDVHVARPVAGEWLLMDATTTLTGTGSALARSTLSDAAGVVAATVQTLVVERRRR